MKRLKVIVFTALVIILLAAWHGVGWSLYIGPFNVHQYASFRNSTGMWLSTPWGRCELTNGMSALRYDGELRMRCWPARYLS